jgi:hypothetical protein
MVYSFPCKGLSHSLLSLFLGILFFKAMVNGIVFLDSFSVCSLSVYRKATNFCKLILYPANLLKQFKMSRSLGGSFLSLLGIRECHWQIWTV